MIGLAGPWSLAVLPFSSVAGRALGLLARPFVAPTCALSVQGRDGRCWGRQARDLTKLLLAREVVLGRLVRVQAELLEDRLAVFCDFADHGERWQFAGPFTDAIIGVFVVKPGPCQRAGRRTSGYFRVRTGTLGELGERHDGTSHRRRACTNRSWARVVDGAIGTSKGRERCCHRQCGGWCPKGTWTTDRQMSEEGRGGVRSQSSDTTWRAAVPCVDLDANTKKRRSS